MKIFKNYLIVSFSIMIAVICNAQTQYKTLLKDFETISGSWTGSLTYLDYSSGKPYTMPADLDIKTLDKTGEFEFSNIYPNEKNANSTSVVTISADGKYIDQEAVKSRQKLANGDVEIITEESGKDGNYNKPATIRHTYILGKTTFKKRKDVQFVGENQWINRHEYSYSRKMNN